MGLVVFADIFSFGADQIGAVKIDDVFTLAFNRWAPDQKVYAAFLNTSHDHLGGALVEKQRKWCGGFRPDD